MAQKNEKREKVVECQKPEMGELYNRDIRSGVLKRLLHNFDVLTNEAPSCDDLVDARNLLEIAISRTMLEGDENGN